MDAEKEEFEPLGYREGKDSERDSLNLWAELLGGSQGDVFASWSGAGVDSEMARRPPSFDAMRRCASVGVIPAIFCVCSGSTGEVFNGE